MDREVLIPSPCSAVTGCVGMVQRCSRGGLDPSLGSIAPQQGGRTLEQAP